MHANRTIVPALLAAVALAGCAATSTGPVAGFDGSWTISKRGLAVTKPESLTHASVQEATAHCAASGERFRQLDLKESPAGILAPQAESELTFNCE